jgi:phosphatidate cytidylyltransferase
LLIWLIGWSSPGVFAAFVILVTLAGLREYFAIAFPHGWKQQLGGICFGVLVAWVSLVSGQSDWAMIFGVLLMWGLFVCLLCRDRFAHWLTWLPRTLLGGLYVGYLVPYFVLLFRRPDGRAWLFWLVLVIMAGDTAGYFIGRCFGTKKLAPAISPGKTVEGAWGYLAGTVVAGSLGAILLFNTFSWFEILSLAVTLAILGQLGDLFESWLKRVFAVKDSGRVLPGHGGVLDRLDSLIFPAVFTTTYLRFFHS